MSTTSDHDPTDPSPRSAGLAGGAARALRAARGRTESAETDAPATATADDEVTETPVPVVETAEPEAPAPTDEDEAEAVVDPDAPPVLASPTARKATGGRTVRARRSTTSSPGDRTRSRLVAASALLTAAALVFAVVAGVVWWRAGHNDARDDAATRDAVAVEARLAIATVNTSDYRKAANALTNWIDVATGSLEKQFTTSRASATTLLTQAKTVTTATVLDVAVTRLDVADGTATVIASVNVKKQPVTGAATTVRNRFRASMAQVQGEWKLADLAQVDVQIS